jgi:hypothetical protein
MPDPLASKAVGLPRRSGCGRSAGIIAVLAVGVTAWGQVPVSGPVLDPTVDRILTRLETRQVHDLRAKVSWKLRYVVDTEEDALTKQGEIWYRQDEPVARFLVRFDRKIVGGRAHKLDERHLFDGRWYVEMNSETKTFTRREIRREGDPTNPYRLGEGPFPVPFGQKKQDVLKEFDVALVPPMASDPPQTDHLRLTPRPGSKTGESYRVVDVWIAQEGPIAGLPIKVESVKLDPGGQVNSFLTITFEDARLNQGFSTSVFELAPPPGFDQHEERLEPVLPAGP